jgi:hypothetical protein
MTPPVPISTLEDAARWLSNATGSVITEREVLGHAFRYMLAKDLEWMTESNHDGDRHAPVLYAVLPKDAEVRLRRWQIGGYRDRLAGRQGYIVPLDREEAQALLTHGSAEITLPRLTDPPGGDGQDEVHVREAIVTPSMIRIYARDLYILASTCQTATAGNVDLDSPADLANALPARAAPEKYLPKQRHQEGAILTALSDNGIDPKELPQWSCGAPGVKSETWKAVQQRKDLFASRKVFDSAWGRLRASGEISERRSSVPLQI